MEKVKGNKRYSYKISKSQGCNIKPGNIVSNIIITVYCGGWLLGLSWQSYHKVDVESLCSAPENNIILYVNYTLILKNIVLTDFLKKHSV